MCLNLLAYSLDFLEPIGAGALFGQIVVTGNAESDQVKRHHLGA